MTADLKWQSVGVGKYLPKWVHVAATKDIVNSNTASYTAIESYFLQYKIFRIYQIEKSSE